MSSVYTSRAAMRSVGLLVLLALLLVAATAGGQPIQLSTRPPGSAKADDLALPMQLPANPRAQLRLKAASDFIKEEAWAEAVRDLQWLLDLKEDSFVEVDKPGADGKKVVTWSSVRTEANRLLASLP